MKTTKIEKVFYGLGGLGYQMTGALTSAYLTLYYTDSVMVSAAFVGTMMLVARILDGISDIAMGFVIEKTRTRFGKARPWVMLGAIPLSISILLLFNVPSHLGEMPKNLYIFVTYVFMSVICYTIVALSHNAMLPRISTDNNDRSVTTVVVGLMQGIMTAVMVGVFNPVLQALGGESSQRAWTIISLMIAVISLLLLAVCFIMTKEKLAAGESLSGKKDEPAQSSIKESLGFLLTDRHFYIIIMLYFTLAVTNGTAGIGVYFMRDVLGDANLMGLFAGLSVVPMIVMMPLVPKLFEKLGKRNTLLYGLSATIAIKIIMLIFPTNIPIQLVTTFLGTAMLVPLWIAAPTMICDIVDYGDIKRGVRTEGLATSASSFGTKLGTGFGSVVLGFGLTIGGYNAELAVQAQKTVSAIIFIMIGIPAVLCALCLALVWLWKLDPKAHNVN